MTRSWDRSRDRLPSDAEIAALILDIRRDALAILPMYHRLHSLGLEPPRTDSVHTSGSGNVREDGSVTGYVPELAVESDRALSRRDYGRWVAAELAKAAKSLDRVQQGLERNVGPGAGYRQPKVQTGPLPQADLQESLSKQAERLRTGAE